jgi:hypothetical protein
MEKATGESFARTTPKNSRGRVGDDAKQIRSEALSELDQPKSPIHLITIVSNSQPIAAHAVIPFIKLDGQFSASYVVLSSPVVRVVWIS